MLTRQEVIEVLTNGGHTAAKAVEIALDYERGDSFAAWWVAGLQEPGWPIKRTIQ